MTTYDRETKDAVRTRDASQTSTFEVRFTDPHAFTDDLKADQAIGAIEDNIVRLSIVNSAATAEQVAAKWVPGPERVNVLWASKYVTASYQARGQLIKLSCYCGVAWAREGEFPNDHARDLTQATAKKVHEALQTVKSVLARIDGLEVRGGGVYINDGDWTAAPGGDIEPAPELICDSCGVRLHWANGHWRDDTGRFDVMRSGAGRHGITTVLDHEHAPEVAS